MAEQATLSWPEALSVGPNDFIPMVRAASGVAGGMVNSRIKALALLLSTSSGIGYTAGAGGAVAQATSKATGVTLNKASGQITLNAANLAATTSVGFTLTNSLIGANDTISVNIASGATADSYSVTVDAVASGSCRISLRNYTAGGLAEAVVLNFNVIKGSAA